jgi:FdhE protein
VTSAAEAWPRRLEERAARAEALAAGSASGREPLLLSAGLFRAQARALAALLELHRRAPLSGQWDRDAPRVRASVGPVLELLGRAAPEGLKGAAQAAATLGAEGWRERLGEAWAGHAEGQDFLARALLRPWATLAVALGLPASRAIEPGGGHCPGCGASPTVGFRQAESGSDGASRWLFCGTCGSQWQVSRIRCPACGETDPLQLPTWQREGLAATRLEGCEACRVYLKSVDLSLDARAIPEVDELTTLSLDFWAVEQGYRRLEPGLAGV